MNGGGPPKEVDIKTLPVYVINMNERKDRWARFMNNIAIRMFENLERFPATNGKKLKYRKEKKISIQTRLRIFRNYRRSHYEMATLGAVGASISHICAWQKFVDSGKEVCLIMEDDAVWFPEYVDKVNELYKTLPDGWGMWILGHYPKNLVIERLKSDKPWNKVYNFTGAHSYILTRAAAKKLLEEPYPIETHIEFYITGTSILKGFQIVHHPDIYVDFYRTYLGPQTKNSANDSNTSQHKKAGCPTCDVPDDYRQIYKHFTHRDNKKGMVVSGIVYDKQPDNVLTFKKSPRKSKTKTRKHKKD